MKPVKWKGSTIPKGSIAEGRLVHVEKRFHPVEMVSIYLIFQSLTVDGTRRPLRLQPRIADPKLGPFPWQSRMSIFFKEAARLVLPQGSITKWITLPVNWQDAGAGG